MGTVTENARVADAPPGTLVNVHVRVPLLFVTPQVSGDATAGHAADPATYVVPAGAVSETVTLPCTPPRLWAVNV
jgi:hypothetical protein